MGEEPSRRATRPDGRDRRTPARTARGADAPLTVEQLVARQGSATGRRAARRAQAPAGPPTSAVPASPPPSATTPPPVPSAHRSRPPVPGAPPRPEPDRAAAAPPAAPPSPPAPVRTPPPAGDGVRRSTPVPPLPGRAPTPLPPHPSSRPRGGRGGPRRPPASPRRRRVVRVLAALVAVVALFCLYELGLYVYADRGMDRVDALATDGPEVLAPQLQAGTENYLVVGSRLPGARGTASVTVLLASLSADGKKAVLLDVPPAALVDTPECRSSSGALREPRTEALVSALLDGGASCAVRAVQELSGLRIDHYLDVDLSRLPAMVDALGGVPVCVLPSAAAAAAASPLPVGLSTVSGTGAAGYLRPGAAADPEGTAAAQRALLLLTSTLRAALSPATLSSPVTMTRFLARSSGALTVDRQTTLGDLRGLGGTLGSLTGNAVRRADLPVADPAYVPAGSRQPVVLLDADATRTLFDAVVGHTRLPAGTGDATPSAAPAGEGGDAAPGPAPAAATASAVAPSSVTVEVRNGTGTAGLAAQVADALRAQGFGVGAVGNATGSVGSTVVRYAPAAQAQAQTVAAAVPGAQLQADPSVAGVQLVVGPGFTGVVPVPTPAPASASPTAAPTAAPSRAAAPVSC